MNYADGILKVCSGRDAVESLAAVLAIQMSAELGKPVTPSEMLLEVNEATETGGDEASV